MDLLKTEWWNNHRIPFNRGLIIPSILTILLTTLLLLSAGIRFRLSLSVIVFEAFLNVAFIGILNMLLVLLEATDRAFDINSSLSRKELLLKVLFWVSVLTMFTYPVFMGVGMMIGGTPFCK